MVGISHESVNDILKKNGFQKFSNLMFFDDFVPGLKLRIEPRHFPVNGGFLSVLARGA